MASYADNMRSFLANVVTMAIPSRQRRHIVREYMKFGLLRYVVSTFRCRRNMREESRRAFAHYLCVCAIAKNEGTYFKEWLEFHRLIGVEKFFIYDNESTDSTREILAPYIEAGIVDYTYWPGKKQQLPAYADWLKRHSDDTRWAIFIDLDEFIVPIEFDNVPAFLNTVPNDVSQLLIGWCIFGSAGHETKPEGLVTQNYKWRQKDGLSVYPKSFFRPGRCWCTEVHYHKVVGRTVDENMNDVYLPILRLTPHVPFKRMRIHHYYCKSWEEYQLRQVRGDVRHGDETIFDRKRFDEFNLNEMYDPIMGNYKKVLQPALERSY